MSTRLGSVVRGGRWRWVDPFAHCDQIGTGILCQGRLEVSNLGYSAIGNDVRFHGSVVASHLATGPSGTLIIGAGAEFAHGLAIAAHDHISIGAGARIGPFALIMDTDFHEAGRHERHGATAPIVIGARAQLGAHVTILRGSTIGEGATVAAGSVVSGEVAPGARVAGVPAREPSATTPLEVVDITMERVGSVLQRALGLDARPAPETRLVDLARWDSLGALNLLLALEQAFQVDLAVTSLAGVERVDRLLPLLLQLRASTRASAS